MKIASLRTYYTKMVDIGKYAFCIETDKTGSLIENKDIYDRAKSFENVDFIGDPFKQKDDIQKILTRLYKFNPKINITIYTPGQIKPTGISKYNVNYIILVPLKNTGQPFSQRIVHSTISWYNGMGAKFVFAIHNMNELDESITIVNSLNIKKNQVYILLANDEAADNKKILDYVKGHNYNITFNIEI